MWADWPLWAMQVLGGEWLVLWFMFIYYLDGLLDELIREVPL